MNSVEKRAILGVGGIFALRMIGLFMIVPVFSVYGDNYAHATPFLIGLAVGIYGLGQAIFQIPMSLAADKFPRKPIIFLGLILFAIGGIIAANATDIYEVIIGRALAGSGAVPGIAQYPGVPRLGGRVAADIDDFFRGCLCYRCQYLGRRALARGIKHDDIRPVSSVGKLWH